MKFGDVKGDFGRASRGDSLEGGVVEHGGVDGEANTIERDRLSLCSVSVCVCHEARWEANWVSAKLPLFRYLIS